MREISHINAFIVILVLVTNTCYKNTLEKFMKKKKLITVPYAVKAFHEKMRCTEDVKGILVAT